MSSDDESLPNMEGSFLNAIHGLVKALYQQYILEDDTNITEDPSQSIIRTSLIGTPSWPRTDDFFQIANYNTALTDNIEALTGRLCKMYRREIGNILLHHLHVTINDWPSVHRNIFERLSSSKINKIWDAWALGNGTLPNNSKPLPQFVMNKAQAIIQVADKHTVRRILKLGQDLLSPSYIQPGQKSNAKASKATQTDTAMNASYLQNDPQVAKLSKCTQTKPTQSEITESNLDTEEQRLRKQKTLVIQESIVTDTLDKSNGDDSRNSQQRGDKSPNSHMDSELDSSSTDRSNTTIPISNLDGTIERNIEVIDNSPEVLKKSSTPKQINNKTGNKIGNREKLHLDLVTDHTDDNQTGNSLCKFTVAPLIVEDTEPLSQELFQTLETTEINLSTTANKDPESPLQNPESDNENHNSSYSRAGAQKLSPNNKQNDKKIHTEGIDNPKQNYAIAVRGQQDPLSNMYMANMKIKGCSYGSAEHYYQAEKARFFGFKSLAENIRGCPSGYNAKRMATNYFQSTFFTLSLKANLDMKQKFHEWHNSIRYTRMTEILHIKFQQTQEFRAALIDSGDTFLAHTVKDKEWGTGSDTLQGYDPTAKNIFGKLLMEIRALKFNVPIPPRPNLPTIQPRPADQHGNASVHNRDNQKRKHSTDSTEFRNTQEPPPKKNCNETCKGIPSLMQLKTRRSPEPNTDEIYHQYVPLSIEEDMMNTPEEWTDHQYEIILVNNHDRPHRDRKDNWEPPLAEFEIMVLGDSNTRLMYRINHEYKNRIAVHCYPGAHFKHISSILRKGPIFSNTKHVILAVGINDREAHFVNTSKKHLSALISNTRLKFPNAKIHFPYLPQRLSVYQTQQFQDVYDFCVTRDVLMLNNPTDIHFSRDMIHLTEASAIRMINHWIDQIKA